MKNLLDSCILVCANSLYFTKSPKETIFLINLSSRKNVTVELHHRKALICE